MLGRTPTSVRIHPSRKIVIRSLIYLSSSDPDQFGTIYLCGAFWNAPYAGEDSQAGTLIHESSHFTDNGGTKDLAYGHEACQNLATNDPDQAILNADSHEYFAENVERFV